MEIEEKGDNEFEKMKMKKIMKKFNKPVKIYAKNNIIILLVNNTM